MNKIKDKLTTFRPFFNQNLYLLRSDLKSFLITFSAFSLIMFSLLSLFQCIVCSSSLSLEEVESIAIVNWMFYMSEFLRLFLKLFKYSLIELRNFLTDSVFLSPLLLYSIQLLFPKLFTLPGL